jgi:integrase/recombinase XerD
MKILEIFIEKLRYKNYSPKTINVYKSYLNNFLKLNNIKDPYQVTTNQIVKFLESHIFTSVSQQNQYIGSLKLFSKYILNKKDMHLSKIERPRNEKKLPRIVDTNTIITSLEKIENLKHKAILSLGFSTGMRVSEILNLKIEDIDSKRMIIHIKNAKGRKDRIVPLTDKMLMLLRQYHREFNPKTYLFNGQNKSKYSQSSCNKIYKRYIDSTSSIHTLRHSCFTTLLENGTDIRIIQKLAGHKNIRTTEIYTHVSTNLLKNIQLPI